MSVSRPRAAQYSVPLTLVRAIAAEVRPASLAAGPQLGQQSKGLLYYRCRFPKEYALAGRVQHSDNVYVAEWDLIKPLDAWLAEVFAPERLADTIEQMYTAQPDPDQSLAAKEAALVITDCD